MDKGHEYNVIRDGKEVIKNTVRSFLYYLQAVKCYLEVPLD
jgi:hypothetical protein